MMMNFKIKLNSTIDNVHNKAIIQWLGFITIGLLVLIVYLPSLIHDPRSDQISYLAEVAHKTSFWDLTIGSIDLNRHRNFDPGDEILFRPVVYIFLGLEKYFFGYNFIYWQAAGIALHLIVVFFLLRLLLTIYSGWEAVVSVAFFALLFVNIEMVVWHHINAYLIFICCVLIALNYFYILIKANKTNFYAYVIISSWLLVAAFTHELANLIAFVIGVVLWNIKPQQRIWVLWIFSVPLIYISTSCLNIVLHPCKLSSMGQNNVVKISFDFFEILGSWLYTGLFPFVFNWAYGDRTVIGINELQLIKPLQIGSVYTASAISFITMYGLIWFNNRHKNNRSTSVFSSVILSFIVIFSIIINFGRGIQHPIGEVLRINTYYMYIFWIFLTIYLYVVIDWASITRLNKILMCFFISIFIFFNSHKLYESNYQRIKIENLIKDYNIEHRFKYN